MEILDLVYQETNNSQSPTHFRPAECGSRQAIQARSDHPDRVISPSRGFSNDMQQVVPTSSYLCLCHRCWIPWPQQWMHSVCHSDAYASPAAIFGKMVEQLHDYPCKRIILIVPGGAHALVLGSSDHVQPNPTEPAQSAPPVGTALPSNPSQKADKPKSPCMPPRTSTIKEQGFSEAVAARIEAPQRGSTRSVYEAKWTIVKKWYLNNLVDFLIANFLLVSSQEVTAKHHWWLQIIHC